MNTDTLRGQWNQLKGSVKEAFGKLTDDDMLQIEGSADRAAGVLQERYGYTKEQAQQEWDNFMHKHDHASDAAANKIQDTKNSLNAKADRAMHKGAQVAKDTADYVERKVKV